MVDFQAFAESIGTDPSRSHWPPPAVNSPNARKKALEEGGFDFSVVESGNGFMTAGQGSSGEMTGFDHGDLINDDRGRMGVDSSSFNEFADVGIPDVPSASFGLSLGSFLPNSSSMDPMMFTNDAFW
jgi:hypothetical protein